jgi:hypothetical protein
MTGIPAWAHRNCERCKKPVAFVRTPRMSKNLPVEVPVNLEADQHGSITAQVVGDVLFGGELPRNKRAAMVAAGHVLYHPHAPTCNEKGKVRR